MLRRCPILQADDRSILNKFRDGVSEFVKKYVHDPRYDPMRHRATQHDQVAQSAAQAVSSAREYYRETAQSSFDRVSEMKEGETIEDYIKNRHERWKKQNLMLLKPHFDEAKKQGISFRPPEKEGGDEIPFVQPSSTDERSTYVTTQVPKELQTFTTDLHTKIDTEKVELRRQLQHESAAEFRQTVAEAKRAQLQEQEKFQRRRPHVSDPSYNPFSRMPDYRPSDSSALASWLQQQREQELTPMGKPIKDKKDQERAYQEEMMVAQYKANPFATRIEHPMGIGNHRVKIEGYSPDSVILNGKEVIGSVIVTPTAYYHWNVSTWEDINEKTLSLIMHMYPVPEILFLGTGRNQERISDDLSLMLRKRGTTVNCLTTREAAANFGLQMSAKRRLVCALVMNIPTNPYKRESFGDFVENDAYSSSDSELGILPQIRMPQDMAPHNMAAEPFRHLQGSGIGPQYHMLSNGKMLRPGTAGTSLRPLVEPNASIDWPQLPSYYNWYPKEDCHDYIERTTWREVGSTTKEESVDSEGRVKYQNQGQARLPGAAAETDEVEYVPWDSSSIPLPKWLYERDENQIVVEDPNTGRVMGMTRAMFEEYLKTMEKRKEGKDDDTVEYDQERFVANKNGFVYDLSKVEYVKLSSHKWQRMKTSRSGRGYMPIN